MSGNALHIVNKFFPEVTKVKDAKSDLEIEVTKQDQNAAKRLKHSECAMAVACKRSLKLDGVIISMGTTYIIKDNVATRYLTSHSVQREITSFDRSGVFASGTFSLKRPNKSKELGHDTRSRTGNHSDFRTKASPHVTTGVRASLLK